MQSSQFFFVSLIIFKENDFALSVSLYVNLIIKYSYIVLGRKNKLALSPKRWLGLDGKWGIVALRISHLLAALRD